MILDSTPDGWPQRWLRWSALFFSICAAGFSYGFVVGQYKIFPYSWLREARAAGQALWGAQAPDEINGLTQYQTQVSQPTVVAHAGETPEGLLLMCSGIHALALGDTSAQGTIEGGTTEGGNAEGTLAWIMDRQGKTLHRWRQPAELWDDLQRVTRVPGVSGAINPVGVHLFDNGDLLATFHGFNTYPFAIGMAKVDRNSRLLWKRELLAHHSFSVAPNGHIFVPALEIVSAPQSIGRTAARIESASGKIYQDLILELDENGQEIARISVKDALVDGGWPGHLIRSNVMLVSDEDPLHLNDVQWIEQPPPGLPNIQRGDLLVSLRNINSVGVVDPQTRRFKWISSGASIGQHSPRILGDSLFVLDNLGGDQRLGGTQLVKIDFRTGQPQTVFPQPHSLMPDLCRTVNSGHLEIDPSGRFALLTITHSGTVWEIDLQTAQVVWEYIHVQPNEADQPQRILGSARYIRRAMFLESGG